MKAKEGRDYLYLEDCCVEVNNGMVEIYDISTSFHMDKKEFDKLVKFVNKKFKGEQTDDF